MTLFCLKLDGFISIPYWLIFLPLFIWKAIGKLNIVFFQEPKSIFFLNFLLATIGALVGSIIWCRNPHSRLEPDSYSHFKAMLISLSLHLILLLFELLACHKCSSADNHLWILVFIPLVFGSVASVGSVVWSVKHDRSFELELFCAVNALQFVFLPLKLDKIVSWR